MFRILNWCLNLHCKNILFLGLINLIINRSVKKGVNDKNSFDLKCIQKINLEFIIINEIVI